VHREVVDELVNSHQLLNVMPRLFLRCLLLSKISMCLLELAQFIPFA
jgi:hypothetical protein